MWLGDSQRSFFESILFETLGRPVEVLEARFVSGGNINTAARIFTPEGTFFVKFNHAEQEDMFEKEVRGLEILHQAGAISIPSVLGHGKNGNKAYLIQEFIENGGQHPNFWTNFGESLAVLHSHTQKHFGLGFNNYIGCLEQFNEPLSNGIDFFIERRLRPQAGLALYNNLLSKELYNRFEHFYSLLKNLLPAERPALIHGVEALTTNFTSLTMKSFRLKLTLRVVFLFTIFIPLLVHVNLFGKSYLPPVERLLKRYVGDK